MRASTGVDLSGRTAAERILFQICRCGHYRYLHDGAWWHKEMEADAGLPCRRPRRTGMREPCPCEGFRRDRAAEGIA